MKRPVRLLPAAVDEFNAASDYYELQRKGRGVRFTARVREVIRRIAANPKLHAVTYQEVRKATVARFPFVVLYREEPGEVIVVSVFHTSRDPQIWQNRV
jgi:plasmid stabilization system protein ParE